MAAVPRRLKRIEVHCPEYQTTATIRIDDAHSSGTDHLEVDYRSPDHSHFTIAIPDDWTDQDLLELIFSGSLRSRLEKIAECAETSGCELFCSDFRADKGVNSKKPEPNPGSAASLR